MNCVSFFCRKTTIENNKISQLLTLISNPSLKGTVVDQTLSSFNRWSLEITITIPLRYFYCYLQGVFYKVLIFILFRDRLKFTKTDKKSTIQLRNYFSIMENPTKRRENAHRLLFKPRNQIQEEFPDIVFSSVWLIVWLFDHNSWTSRPICLNF